MTDRWRLVRTQDWGPGRQELFDIKADPAQRHNLSDTRPEIVGQLLEAYDGWWDSISERFDHYGAAILGSDN